MREEFETIGAPPFKERGEVGDEYVRVFKELWTSDSPTFEGKYTRFSNVIFEPKPQRKPHPPIWIGGESPRALRRAARLGDAWYPIGTNPRYPVGTPDQLLGSLAKLRSHAEDAGRNPEGIAIAYSARWRDDPRARMVSDIDRPCFTGTPAQVAGDIRAFEQLGVQHLVLDLQRGTLDETLEHMERFIIKVVPLV